MTHRSATMGGCCAGTDEPASFTERADLGRRRLAVLRKVTAWSSAALAAAALLVQFGLVPLDGAVAGRLALAAALLGVPRLLGHLRQALVARRPTVPAVAGLALVAAALAGLVLPVAVAVAIYLVTDLVTAKRQMRACAASPAAETRRTPAYGGKVR